MSSINLANQVTWLRILMIPAVVGVYHSGLPWANWAAAALFGIASLSDWLDGFLARRLGQTSSFGAFIDPVADKLLVTMVLIMLVAGRPDLLVATAIIIMREILTSALREWMAGLGKRKVVAVIFSSKIKTTVQMIAIIVLLLYTADFPDWFRTLGGVLLYLAAALSIHTMLLYFQAAWRAMHEDGE